MSDAPDARAEAIKRIKAKRAFQQHLVVYLVVNLVLWIIWGFTGAGFPWPIFVTFFWGIGVVTQAWTVYGRGDRITEDEIQREMRRGEGAT